MYISSRRLGFVGVCLFVLMLAVPSMAQNRTVRGKVTAIESGDGIANASIEIRNRNPSGPSYNIKTDKGGNYVYMGLPRGDYYIIVRAEGFAPDYRPVRPSIQEASIIDFQLKPGNKDNKIVIDFTPEEIAKMRQEADKAKERQSVSGEVQKLFDAGLALAKEGNYTEAIEQFKAALEQDPEQANILGNMADSYSKLGQNEEALKTYQQAIAVKPDAPELYTNMGAVLNNMGRIEESQEAFKKAATLNPGGSAQSSYNIGVTLYNNGKTKEAAEAFKQAVAADPEYAEAYYLLGMCLSGDLDKMKEAIAALKKYIEIGKKPDQVDTAKAIIETLESSSQ